MNKKLILLVVALLVLNVLDISTTYCALALGAVEINPFMAKGFSSGHAVLYKVLGVTAAVLLTMWRIRQDAKILKFYTHAYTAFCVIYSLVVLNNVVVIFILRRMLNVS